LVKSCDAGQVNISLAGKDFRLLSDRSAAESGSGVGVHPSYRVARDAEAPKVRPKAKAHVQLLLGCTALNCKRLADHVPEAAGCVAAAPAAAARDLQTTTPVASVVSGAAAPDAAGSAPAARPSSWNYTVCLN
jgi:hypothetical protein